MPLLRVRLGDKDRERIGCEEWLDLDYSVLMQLEAEVLQHEIPGFEPDGWFAFLREQSNVHWRHAIVWLALRRNGIRLPYGEVDFNRHDIELDVPGVTEPEGKDDGSTPDRTSNENDEPTSPSSPTSSDSSPSTNSPELSPVP